MIQVSVPCPCGADIAFRDAACPACKTPVSRALRDDLEARLEHAHTEYGEAKQSVRRAATAMIVLGALYVVFALLIYYLLVSDPGLAPVDSLGDAAPLLTNGLLGLLLIACAVGSRRSPIAAFAVALALWLVTQTLVYVALPAQFFLEFLSARGIAGLFAKVIVVVMLVRGLLAARRVDEIRRDVERGAAA
ncbi:hypothetical protein [Polyangium mundeleinium]|uniref:Zinc ribbon domain-containing protein n=1 Tax=Polyangium mundeleinium TaxID=2995306 RepID=A0ABT5F0H5_9BACT|nr:hypothetical protein [Polyangium mundeleinium]MDC0747578.1 hypothetical protein [Polyangium mundeleinium]